MLTGTLIMIPALTLLKVGNDPMSAGRRKRESLRFVVSPNHSTEHKQLLGAVPVIEDESSVQSVRFHRLARGNASSERGTWSSSIGNTIYCLRVTSYVVPCLPIL